MKHVSTAGGRLVSGLMLSLMLTLPTLGRANAVRMATPLGSQAHGAPARLDSVASENLMVAQADDVVASDAAAGELDDVTRLRVNRMLYEAQQLADADKKDEAIAKVREALNLWPSNERAQTLLQDLTGAVAAVPAATAADALSDEAKQSSVSSAIPVLVPTNLTDNMNTLDYDKLKQLDTLHNRARQLYNEGRLGAAREKWNEMLTVDPGNKLAQTWLENTREAYDRQVADGVTEEQAAAKAEARRKLLDAPITISTDREIPLTEFLYLLSFTTPQELEYSIGPRAQARVFANFVDKSLRDVLDTVLLDAGLDWSIDDNNVIHIVQDIKSKTFTLTPSQMGKLRTLYESGQVQKLVWGQTESPADGIAISLDERQNLLLVTGSDRHIKAVESLLPSLQDVAEAELTTAFYKINPSDGPRIRAFINSVLTSRGETVLDVERKIIINEDDLVVRETPENIRKIEELLLDKGFIQRLRNDQLDIQVYSLVPREIENLKTDQIQVFTSRVIEAIKVFLYGQEGERKANEEGRQLWYDEASLQLTLIDTPTNLQRVANYIDSLPQLGEKAKQEVVQLRNAVAEDLAGNLERILNLTAGETGTSAGGDEVTFKLRRGEEREFRTARIRLIRVEENDEEDRNDDTAELNINTGTQVNQVTVRELESQYAEDYEITADDVQPNSGQPGEGSARITIRYVPRSGGISPELLQLSMMQQQAPKSVEEEGITINPFGELNMLIIRYTDPQKFKEVRELITELDKPVRQVEIETRFVEVNETKAREVSSEFDIAGLGSGRKIDYDTQVINTNFARDIDEFKSVFDTQTENPLSQNLLKGTTALSAVIGGYPQINYSLRLLEAEGVINLVNGPKVTALDAVEAEFRIESYVSDTQTQQQGNQNLVNIFNPVEQGFGVELSDQDEATEEDQLVSAVVLRVTPEITSEDSIILRDLSAELLDFVGYVNDIIQPQLANVQNQTDNQAVNYTMPKQAIGSVNYQPLVRRKRIMTDARIGNGGTIVLGGWTGERSQELSSGIPVLRNMPYIGKLLFSRNQWTRDRTTLLIFLTAGLVE